MQLFSSIGGDLGTLVATQRIATSYNAQGQNCIRVTSYDNSSGGNVVNQIQYGYNGFGQETPLSTRLMGPP